VKAAQEKLNNSLTTLLEFVNELDLLKNPICQNHGFSQTEISRLNIVVDSGPLLT
jgi:hypothetical protein